MSHTGFALEGCSKGAEACRTQTLAAMESSSRCDSPVATAYLTARPVAPPSLHRGPGQGPTWLEDRQAGSHSDPVLSVIIPTYNERDNIALLVSLLRKHLSTAHLPDVAKSAALDRSLSHDSTSHSWWELIVVDDNSPDGTAAEVARLMQHADLGSNVSLVQRPGKLGLGTAYMEGLIKARGQWVVLMDADLSHHPKYLPAMLARQAATRCDIVSGTRYQRGGGVSGWNLRRKVNSRGANLLAQTLLGVRQSDLTGSYRLYRRSCLQRLLQETTSRGYAFQMEVAVRAHRHRFSVEEVPIVFVDRLYGESKLGFDEFKGFLIGLARLLCTL